MVSTPTTAFMTLPVLVIGPDPTDQLNPFAECDLPSPAKWYLPPDLTARLSDNADTEDEIHGVLDRLNERSRAEHQLEPVPNKAAFYWSLTNPQTRFRSYELIGQSRVVPSHSGRMHEVNGVWGGVPTAYAVVCAGRWLEADAWEFVASNLVPSPFDAWCARYDTILADVPLGTLLTWVKCYRVLTPVDKFSVIPHPGDDVPPFVWFSDTSTIQ